MKILKSIVIGLICCLYSCSKVRIERKKILFRDTVTKVQDSLCKIQLLLNRLPKRNDNKNINYNIENGQLFINDSLVNKQPIKSGKFLGIYNVKEKNSLINISIYLNYNYLSSAYYDEAGKIWRFIYRDFPERSFDDTRDICVLNNEEVKSIVKTDTILDVTLPKNWTV